MLQQLLDCTSFGLAFLCLAVPKGKRIQFLFEKTVLEVLLGYLSYLNK